jgi:hypothetical protein
MPLKKGITVDDVIKAICHECCSPPEKPETEKGRAVATSVSNAGYMILIKMGSCTKRSARCATAQKVRFAAFFKQQERKSKRGKPH